MSMSHDPFHEGERRVQQRAGQTREADRNSPLISSRIPAGAISFLREQALLVMAVSYKDELWCLPLLGEPGWMSVPVPNQLKLDVSMKLSPVDPRILHAAEESQLVGGLVLDFMGRRRLRVNGRLSKDADTSLTLSVTEAYPNCPKYITRRNVHWAEMQNVPQLSEGTALSAKQQDTFRSTDVFFIASQHPTHGLDASHRGGNPGFVECISPEVLRFQDFSGNSLFNTLGNFEIDNHVGLLLPDFGGGRAIEVTGTARVIYGDSPEFRMVEVHVTRCIETSLAGSETQTQLSPFNP